MAELVQHLINGLAAGTIYALVALGYTMVYGVLKLINFAHGDVMMVGVYLGYATAHQLGLPHGEPTMVGAAVTGFVVLSLIAGLLFLMRTARSPVQKGFSGAALAALAAAGVARASLRARGSILEPGTWTTIFGVLQVFVVAMTLCAVLGFLIERFAYRPLRDKPRLVSLITAIGVSFTIAYGFQLETKVGGVTVLPGAAPKAFPEIIRPTEWIVIGDRDIVVWNWQVISIVIAIGLMVALQYLVFKTKFGTAMRAVSFDHKTSALMGIPVDRIIALTFMLGSALAAGAGILYAIKDTLVQPLMGVQVGLKAFVAAVIGGIGHVPGAVVGALLLGLVEEFVVGYGSSTWRDAVAFSFLILVLLFKPEGLFGKVTAEKV